MSQRRRLGQQRRESFQSERRPNKRLKPTAPRRRNSRAHFHSWRSGRGRGGLPAGRSATPATRSNFYSLKVKCKRCGEVIEGRVNLNNDLSETCNAHGIVIGYFCRKVLMGEGRCYQQIEVRLTFDPGHRLKERQIAGGEFV